MSKTELVKFNPTNQERTLIRQTIAPKLTEPEFELYIAAAKHTGLNPMLRQIYPVVYAGKLVIQTGIDGFRLQAERSQKYLGQLGPMWCGPDGKWVDVWVKDEPPVAAKVGILKSGCSEPFWGIAKYSSFVKIYNGKPGETWAKMPDVMLAKCAEAQGHRKAFPVETAGIYIPEEIDPDNVTDQAFQDAKNVTPQGKPKVDMPKAKSTEAAPAKHTTDKSNAPCELQNLRPDTVSQLTEMMDEMDWSLQIQTGRLQWADGEKVGDEKALKSITETYKAFLDGKK